MILKRETYDSKHRLETRWVPEIDSAVRYFDDDWQTDVIEMSFKSNRPAERVILRGDEGVYLCNDEGKTIEVLSRLRDPAR
jgi:hypothetical protein